MATGNNSYKVITKIACVLRDSAVINQPSRFVGLIKIFLGTQRTKANDQTTHNLTESAGPVRFKYFPNCINNHLRFAGRFAIGTKAINFYGLHLN